ncbi:exported hypothetical protein [Capnocytophaga cynodegmi]|uniref:Secreted protein n=1 Tax=Capnocytophaga cynodegmi TaxID=28189 RepID=A0A0B7HQD8_9FLAO|nr:exported hypothetical protein [Capnocytophaga cynodegmi]
MKALSFVFRALRTICLNCLSAFSVTEQVFITYISAGCSKSTRSNPSVSKLRAMVEVSEKFNLQPNVWNATFFLSSDEVIFIFSFLGGKDMFFFTISER